MEGLVILVNMVLSERLNYIDTKIKGNNNIFDNIGNKNYLDDLKKTVTSLSTKIVGTELELSNNISKEMKSIRSIIDNTSIDKLINMNIMENKKLLTTHLYLTKDTIDRVFTSKLFSHEDNPYLEILPLFISIDIDFKNRIITFSPFSSMVDFVTSLTGLELSLINTSLGKVKANKLEKAIYDSETFRFLLTKNVVDNIERDRKNTRHRERTMDFLVHLNSMDKDHVANSVQFYNDELTKIVDVLIDKLWVKYNKKFALQISK